MESPLPKRLKQARSLAGLTQQQLGIKLDLEPNTASARMNQYEKGKHSPDYVTVKRLAKELNVPVAYLYCDDDLLAECLLKISKISDEDKKELIEQLSNK